MLEIRRRKNVLAGTFNVLLKEEWGGAVQNVRSVIILGKCWLTVKYCIPETMWKVKKFHQSNLLLFFSWMWLGFLR